MEKTYCNNREKELDLHFKGEGEFDGIVARALIGDEGARAELVDKLQPLLVSSIRRYFNDYSQYDDLMQDGNLKIIECLNDFDSSKGVHFLGYIKSKLKFMYLNKHRIRVHSSLNKEVGEDGMEIVDLLLSDEKPAVELITDEEDIQALNLALCALTKRQGQVIRLYYIEGKNMLEIAELLGINYRTVINTKTAALKKLKKEISRKK